MISSQRLSKLAGRRAERWLLVGRPRAPKTAIDYGKAESISNPHSINISQHSSNHHVRSLQLFNSQYRSRRPRYRYSVCLWVCRKKVRPLEKLREGAHDQHSMKIWPTLNNLDQINGIQVDKLGQCWYFRRDWARQGIDCEVPVAKKNWKCEKEAYMTNTQ